MNLRATSLALGATKIQTIFKVVVPAAKSGIITGIVLGIGRALGEAMAINLVAGGSVNLPLPFNSVRFLTTQIVSEMYEVFAKENARAAGQANYQEGKAWNEKYYSDGHSDWTYYNSDYYYQCNDTNAALRESARKMTEKWELDGIDCDEIEANSSLTLDGGFDFNSIWNSDFRNQVGRSSLAKESTIPPENFKMFFKEQVTSFTEENKFNGNLKITIGKSNYDLNVPFQTLRTGSEGEIRNVWDLMEDYYSDTKDNSKVKNFLRNMSVFTRWYSYETGINDRFGDYLR